MRALPLLMLVACLLFAGSAFAHGDRHLHYVAGTGAADLGLQTPCAPTLYMDFVVGAACHVQVHLGETSVSVEDAALGAIPFSWALADTAGNPCADGRATGNVVLAIAMPCRYVTIVPGVGATAGEIVLAQH